MFLRTMLQWWWIFTQWLDSLFGAVHPCSYALKGNLSQLSYLCIFLFWFVLDTVMKCKHPLKTGKIHWFEGLIKKKTGSLAKKKKKLKALQSGFFLIHLSPKSLLKCPGIVTCSVSKLDTFRLSCAHQHLVYSLRLKILIYMHN